MGFGWWTWRVKEGPLRAAFDRQIKLEFHGARITSDCGLLAYRAAPAFRARLQSRQLPAVARFAAGGRAVVAHDLAREAGQDRRPDRAPRAVHGLPTRRGGGAASAVCRDPASDRPAARATRCGGLTGARTGVAASTEGRTMRRDRPVAYDQPGSARKLAFSASPPLGLAASHVSRLIEDRWRSRVSNGTRAHLGNIGSERLSEGNWL